MKTYRSPDEDSSRWIEFPFRDGDIVISTRSNGEARDDVVARLEAQTHRRFIKTHTPLDGIPLGERDWHSLVEAATFESMRAAADRLAPPPDGGLKDRSAFFRRGRPGAAAEILDDADIARYRVRAAELCPPGLFAWLHDPSERS